MKLCLTSSQISLEKSSKPAKSSRLMLWLTEKKPILRRKRRKMDLLVYTRASSCVRRSKNNSRNVNVIANKNLRAVWPKVPEELLEPVALKVIARRRQGLVKVQRQKMRSNL